MHRFVCDSSNSFHLKMHWRFKKAPKTSQNDVNVKKENEKSQVTFKHHLTRIKDFQTMMKK